MRPVGLEPTHPNKRGTGLSFRRVYHSTTGTKASQSRRTTGSYRSIISHAATRAQAVDAPTPKQRGKHHAPRGLCRTRTYDQLGVNQTLYQLS